MSEAPARATARGATSARAPKAVGTTKSEKTRRRILDAAANVLSRRGYANTRLTEIADIAQTQAPAIYYYYASREDLLEEVMLLGTRHILSEVEAALAGLPPDTPPMERIEVAIAVHLRHMLEVSDYATATTRNSSQVPDAIRDRLLAEQARYTDVWRVLIHDLSEARQLRPELDARSARWLVVGAINWTAEWFNPKRDRLETVTRSAQSMIRHGLADDDALD